MTQRLEYEINISSPAQKDLDDLADTDYRRIDQRIVALATEPRPPGTSKLKDLVYRIRVGPWRVIYLIDDKQRVIVIQRVRRRGKDTYRQF